MKAPLISRRTVLRGVGTAVALPLLDAMLPAGFGKPAAAGPPRRMAFVYSPNGAYMPYWMPKTEGPGFELTPCLAPMAEHREGTALLALMDVIADLIAGAPDITYVTPVGAKIDPSVAMPRSIADA